MDEEDEDWGDADDPLDPHKPDEPDDWSDTDDWSETADWGAGAPSPPPRPAFAPLVDWRTLSPEHHWEYFDQLWDRVGDLRRRYRLPVRTRWWEDGVLIELLAALSGWVERFDRGDWDDPPGKLALLFELERIDALLRDGNEPIDPVRDRPEFDDHLDRLGCEPPG